MEYTYLLFIYYLFYLLFILNTNNPTLGIARVLSEVKHEEQQKEASSGPVRSLEKQARPPAVPC